MIEQATRRRNKNVDPTIELANLLIHRHTADQQRHIELMINTVFDEALLDLCRQFPRRCQNQRSRHASPRAARLEAGNHRDHEGGRLAGACLGNTQHIASGDGDGNSLGLDGSRGRISGRCHCGQNLGAETKLSERRRFQKVSLRVCMGAVASEGSETVTLTSREDRTLRPGQPHDRGRISSSQRRGVPKGANQEGS